MNVSLYEFMVFPLIPLSPGRYKDKKVDKYLDKSVVISKFSFRKCICTYVISLTE